MYGNVKSLCCGIRTGHKQDAVQVPQVDTELEQETPAIPPVSIKRQHSGPRSLAEREKPLSYSSDYLVNHRCSKV